MCFQRQLYDNISCVFINIIMILIYTDQNTNSSIKQSQCFLSFYLIDLMHMSYRFCLSCLSPVGFLLPKTFNLFWLSNILAFERTWWRLLSQKCVLHTIFDPKDKNMVYYNKLVNRESGWNGIYEWNKKLEYQDMCYILAKNQLTLKI